MLFYKTEGQFGTDNFKCIAKELYLMDIGTAGHTEYEYGPEFFKLLMDRPDLRDGHYKGHIHSHCNMSVFFSGTDTGELYGNAPNHNLYLSLIVNNKNEMCARIAFQAVQKKITLQYKDERGKPIEQVVEHVSEDPVIFEYECDPILPGGAKVDDIKARIEEIREKKFQSSRGGTGGFSRVSTYPTQTERTVSTTDSRVYDFVIKLINLDPKVVGSLTRTFERMTESRLDHGQRLDNHIAAMDDRLYEFYERRFPEDKKYELFSQRMAEAANVLDEHTKKFPKLARDFRHFFNSKVEVKYNYDDSESRSYEGYY